MLWMFSSPKWYWEVFSKELQSLYKTFFKIYAHLLHGFPWFGLCCVCLMLCWRLQVDMGNWCQEDRSFFAGSPHAISISFPPLHGTYILIQQWKDWGNKGEPLLSVLVFSINQGLPIPGPQVGHGISKLLVWVWWRQRVSVLHHCPLFS